MLLHLAEDKCPGPMNRSVLYVFVRSFTVSFPAVFLKATLLPSDGSKPKKTGVPLIKSECLHTKIIGSNTFVPPRGE